MKKTNRIFVLACMMLLLASCGKKAQISLSPATVEMAPEGGSVEVSLFSNGDWTVASHPDWIALSSVSGNGDLTLTLTATANEGLETRSGEVSVSTKDNSATLTVTQASIGAFLTISPETIECDFQGGAFDVEVRSNVDWQLSQLPDWITASATSGAGNGHVVLTVASIVSDDSDSREVSLTFSGEGIEASLQVKQSVGMATGFTVSPMQIRVDYQGGVVTVDVTTTLAWTATAEVDWVTVSPAAGEGDAEVTVNMTENGLAESREATIRFDYTLPDGSEGSTSVWVRQGAAPVQHVLTVSPHEVHFGKEGGTAEISVECDTKWGVETQTGWIVLSEMGGEESTTLVMTVGPNVIVEPRAFVVVFSSEAGLTESVTVTQDAGDELPTVSLSPDTLFVPYLGAVATLHITSNVDWQLVPSVDWVMMLNTSGSGDGSRDVIVYENRTGATRYGEVKALYDGQVASRTVLVQEPMPVVLETDITEIEARPEGGTYTVNVTSTLNWTVSKGANWIAYTPDSGSGDGQITITVTPLLSSHPRSAEIYISGEYDTQVVISVTQSN